jgi:hypothetical protein
MDESNRNGLPAATEVAAAWERLSAAQMPLDAVVGTCLGLGAEAARIGSRNRRARL